jgi:hypothetical protein
MKRGHVNRMWGAPRTGQVLGTGLKLLSGPLEMRTGARDDALAAKYGKQRAPRRPASQTRQKSQSGESAK